MISAKSLTGDAKSLHDLLTSKGLKVLLLGKTKISFCIDGRLYYHVAVHKYSLRNRLGFLVDEGQITATPERTAAKLVAILERSI